MRQKWGENAFRRIDERLDTVVFYKVGMSAAGPDADGTKMRRTGSGTSKLPSLIRGGDEGRL